MPDPLRLIRQVERPTVTFLRQGRCSPADRGTSAIARIGRHCEEPQGDEAIL